MKLAPTPGEFEAWRAHPITEMVTAALGKLADQQRDTWTHGVWSQDYMTAEERERSLIAMNRAKVRADAYRAISEVSLADVIKVLDLTPAPEERQPAPGVYK